MEVAAKVMIHKFCSWERSLLTLFFLNIRLTLPCVTDILKPEQSSRRKRESNPGSAAFEADAITATGH